MTDMSPSPARSDSADPATQPLHPVPARLPGSLDPLREPPRPPVDPDDREETAVLSLDDLMEVAAEPATAEPATAEPATAEPATVEPAPPAPADVPTPGASEWPFDEGAALQQAASTAAPREATAVTRRPDPALGWPVLGTVSGPTPAGALGWPSASISAVIGADTAAPSPDAGAPAAASSASAPDRTVAGATPPPAAAAAPRGDAWTQLRTDAATACRAGARRSAAWFAVADHALVVATAIVALILVVVVAAR